MGSKTKVLVVDDEELLRSSISKILEVYGYNVSVAGSATEAIEKIVTETYDVLLSDLRMPPPGDGLSVIAAMQQACPSCITLLMSANFDPTASPTVRLKSDEILKKPLEIPVLLKLIRRKLKTSIPA